MRRSVMLEALDILTGIPGLVRLLFGSRCCDLYYCINGSLCRRLVHPPRSLGGALGGRSLGSPLTPRDDQREVEDSRGVRGAVAPLTKLTISTGKVDCVCRLSPLQGGTLGGSAQ